MTIIHILDDFLFEVFSNEDKDVEKLKKDLTDFYTVGDSVPKIEVKDDHIVIEIDISEEHREVEKYNKLISMCEAKRFDEAKVLALDLIDISPNISEFHRILGQIYSELGDQDKAIDSLIDALKWDPENIHALLMTGNIFSKFRNNIETAMKYYDQVLKINPDDHITLTNIGIALVKTGKTEEGKKYCEKALSADPDYPNTHLAMAMIADMENDLKNSFEYALNAIEKSKAKDQLYYNSINHALKAAKKLCVQTDGFAIINSLKDKLAYLTGKEIRIEKNDSIDTAAKIEFAENYKREYHLVKYKSSYPAEEHLIMHELMHLELAHESREKNENQLFTSTTSQRSKFYDSLKKEAKRYKKKGYSDDSIKGLFDIFFDGLNLQAYNTPIDLFIEDRIYRDFPDMRPFQFLSLMVLLQEGIDAVTKKEIVEGVSGFILSRSKIYNLVNAMHFKTLFKVDLIEEFKASKNELNQATEFYNEFLKYRNDREAGEEYELVLHWAEDLKIDSYFELIPENRDKRKTIENVMSEIENDPYGIENIDPSKERKMKKFLEQHSDKPINMAVTMYMVGALEKFKKLDTDTIRKIAFEFATLGMGGITPDKDDYMVPYFGGETFTGYRALAYYYVSWAIAIPEMVSKLELPFEKEYQMAIQLSKL